MDDAANPYAASAPEVAPVETAAPGVSNMGLYAEAEKLLKTGKGGATWFYWIAGLSLVNSIIFVSGGEIFFVCGLGVTMFVDAIAGEVAKQTPEAATIVRGIAFAISLGVLTMVVGCGWLSRRGNLWPFGIGIALYTLDALIFLLIGDLMSFGFHVFALFGMVAGWRAFSKYNTFVQAWQDEQLLVAAEPAV